MAIEIKELHIRVSVNMSPGGPNDSSPSNPQGSGTNGPAASGDDAKDAIVAECVEQVLQILHNKAER